jgi:hypothetical protein
VVVSAHAKSTREAVVRVRSRESHPPLSPNQDQEQSCAAEYLQLPWLQVPELRVGEEVASRAVAASKDEVNAEAEAAEAMEAFDHGGKSNK